MDRSGSSKATEREFHSFEGGGTQEKKSLVGPARTGGQYLLLLRG